MKALLVAAVLAVGLAVSALAAPKDMPAVYNGGQPVASPLLSEQPLDSTFAPNAPIAGFPDFIPSDNINQLNRDLTPAQQVPRLNGPGPHVQIVGAPPAEGSFVEAAAEMRSPAEVQMVSEGIIPVPRDWLQSMAAPRNQRAPMFVPSSPDGRGQVYYSPNPNVNNVQNQEQITGPMTTQFIQYVARLMQMTPPPNYQVTGEFDPNPNPNNLRVTPPQLSLVESDSWETPLTPEEFENAQKVMDNVEVVAEDVSDQQQDSHRFREEPSASSLSSALGSILSAVLSGSGSSSSSSGSSSASPLNAEQQAIAAQVAARNQLREKEMAAMNAHSLDKWNLRQTELDRLGRSQSSFQSGTAVGSVAPALGSSSADGLGKVDTIAGTEVHMSGDDCYRWPEDAPQTPENQKVHGSESSSSSSSGSSGGCHKQPPPAPAPAAPAESQSQSAGAFRVGGTLIKLVVGGKAKPPKPKPAMEKKMTIHVHIAPRDDDHLAPHPRPHPAPKHNGPFTASEVRKLRDLIRSGSSSSSSSSSSSGSSSSSSSSSGSSSSGSSSSGSSSSGSSSSGSSSSGSSSGSSVASSSSAPASSSSATSTSGSESSSAASSSTGSSTGSSAGSSSGLAPGETETTTTTTVVHEIIDAPKPAAVMESKPHSSESSQSSAASESSSQSNEEEPVQDMRPATPGRLHIVINHEIGINRRR